MPLLRRRFMLASLMSATVVACADQNLPVDPERVATLRFVNTMSSGEAVDVVVGSTVVRVGLQSGGVFEWQVSPSSATLRAGVRLGPLTLTTPLGAIQARERILVVVHGSTPSLGILRGDTNTVRLDRVNVRIAFAAPSAPLVKAYVQPETQSSLGPLPWVSTQSFYSAPLFTSYYRAAPSTGRLTVIFAEYNPSGAEPILAVSPPFEASSASAWLVTFDRTSAGYVALVAREPVHFPLD